MRHSFICAVIAILFTFLSNTIIAQTPTIVIMGSSSAAGYGAGVYDSAWGGRLTAYYKQNMYDNLDTNVVNIAWPSQTTYHEMPTGFVPAIAGRPLPNPNYNVTKALSYNPNIVIINLPSNDIYNGFAKEELMDNLRTMFYTVSSAGAKCFITTSQPRDDIGMDKRDSLRTIVDSTFANFGFFTINFWADLVSTDGTLSIKPELSAGDMIHINPTGHNLMFLRVLQKQMFVDNAPLPVRLIDFKATLSNNVVNLQWKTITEEPRTVFEIQRSTDGAHFEKIHQLQGTSPTSGASYSWADQHPLEGKSYYRLKFGQNRAEYSKIVSVSNKNGELNISKLYKQNSSTLVAVLNSRKNQQVNISIIGMNGELVKKQSQYITSSGNTITLAIDKLAAGQYYLRVDIPTGEFALKAFNK